MVLIGVFLAHIFEQWIHVIILIWDSLRKVSVGVIIQNLEPSTGIGLNDGNVVLFDYLDFYTHSIFGILIAIFLKVNSYNTINFISVLLVAP